MKRESMERRGPYEGFDVTEHHYQNAALERDPKRTRFWLDDVPRHMNLTMHPDRPVFHAKTGSMIDARKQIKAAQQEFDGQKAVEVQLELELRVLATEVLETKRAKPLDIDPNVEAIKRWRQERGFRAYYRTPRKVEA